MNPILVMLKGAGLTLREVGSVLPCIDHRAAFAFCFIICGFSRAGATDRVAIAPAPRWHMSSVYDEAHHEVLIYGGFTLHGKVEQAQGDLWAWNGAGWHFVGDTGLPKVVALMAFDSKRDRILMFGGAGDSGSTDGKLNVLENARWRTLTDDPTMSRLAGDFVYDSKRDHVLMFGGRNGQVNFADTWEYDGKNWIQTWVAGPSLRSAAISAYDSDRGVTVLYGGFRPLAGLGDTWEWDGKTWRMVSNSGPGPRAWPGLAYDSRRHRTILFGGENEKGIIFHDTWSWNGKKWTRIATAGPPARIQFAMEYDSARDRIVLFGGQGEHGPLNDVWEFDGTKWETRRP